MKLFPRLAFFFCWPVVFLPLQAAFSPPTSSQAQLTSTLGTSRTVGATGTNYSYNPLNQLTSFTSGGNTVAFTYDANGNRVSRTQGGTSDTLGKIKGQVFSSLRDRSLVAFRVPAVRTLTRASARTTKPQKSTPSAQRKARYLSG